MKPVSASEMDWVSIRSDADAAIKWEGAFASYGGFGADQSSTVVFEIAPGGHLGWHTDQTEETQYVISGTGELRREDGQFPVDPGTVFVLPTNVRHDLANTGTEPLRAVAFFSAGMFTQKFDEVVLPAGSKVIGTPNREG
jgi:quercetin dioxygenase-like cupin family protein